MQPPQYRCKMTACDGDDFKFDDFPEVMILKEILIEMRKMTNIMTMTMIKIMTMTTTMRSLTIIRARCSLWLATPTAAKMG